MAPGSILSTQIPSDRSQYELYEVWFNEIDHIHTYGAAKVDFFCHFSVFSKMEGTVFYVGISTFSRRSPNPCTNLVQTTLLWHGWARNHLIVDHTTIFHIYKVFKNLLVQWMVIWMFLYFIKDMKVDWADWIWLTTGYKPYHYDIVKARNHFIVTYTYIIYIYKVFKHLPMQWMVICRPPYFFKAMDWDGWIWVTNG